MDHKEAEYKEAIAIVQEELRLLQKEKQNEVNSHMETLEELNAAKAEINKLKEKNENMVDMDEGKKWLVRQYKQQSLLDKLTIGSLNAQILKLRHKDLNPSARTEVNVPPTPTSPSNPALKSYRRVRDQEHGKRLKGMRQENIDKKLKDAGQENPSTKNLDPKTQANLQKSYAEFDKIAASLPQVKGLGDMSDLEMDKLAI
jgi:hypothetical protein